MRLLSISKKSGSYSRSERGNGGFTLAEALVSIMIAALSGTLILCGISLWIRIYEKTEKAGNAETVFEQVYEDIRNGLLCSLPQGESKIYSEKYGCTGKYECETGGVFFAEDSGRKWPLISKRLASAAGGEDSSPFEIDYEWNEDGYYSGELRLVTGDPDTGIRRRIEVVPVFSGSHKAEE